MKALVWLVAFSLLASAARADDKKDPPKEDPVKVVVDQLDKAWGIKLKSVTAKDNNSGGFDTQVKITLEFTKDVTELKAFKEAFAASPNVVAKTDNPPLVFHLFDEDNVSLGKYLIREVEGDLSGVKGDAFRILLQPPTATLKKAAKIEARLANPPKPEK